MNVLTTSVTTTPSLTYDIILVNASGGDVTIHLPAAPKDKFFIIKKIDSSINNVIVDTSNTIEFAPLYNINTFLSAIKTVFNGIQWFNI